MDKVLPCQAEHMLNKAEALEILHACKPLIKRLEAVSDYRFNEDEQKLGRRFVELYKSKQLRDAELLEAADISLKNVAFFLGHLIMRKQVNQELI